MSVPSSYKHAALLTLFIGLSTYASSVLLLGEFPVSGTTAAITHDSDSHDPHAQIYASAAVDMGVTAEPSPPAPSAIGSSSESRQNRSDNGGFRYHSNGVPVGFEAWFEPQKVALDVFYGGRYLLTTLVEYTSDRILFLNPSEVSARIPGVLDQDSVSALLSSALPTNSDKVCQQPNQPLCGRIEPDKIGLIFDETRIRADLFVHRSLLSAIAEADPRYLPEGDQERVTLVQNLNALYTSDDLGNERFSLFGRTRAGRNGHHVFSDWVSTSEQSLSIDQIGYRHDLRDHIITTGLFETNLDMLRGMNRDLLLGAAVERSMKRRTDLDSIIATPIELFLPTRGRVDIFRDGRLISSGFYEAGNQRIDTSRLPTGAYLIEIVTTDASGNISSEEQLFVKSSLLAPPGEAIWFAEAGKVARRAPLDTFPEELDVTLVRGGYRWRQLSWLGLGVAGAATEDAMLAEASANMMFDRLEAGGELYKSSAGGWGYGARSALRQGKHTVTLNARYSRADSLPAEDDPQYRMIDNDRWLYSGQLNSRISNQATIGLTSSITGGRGLSSSRFTNLRYSHYWFLPANSGLTFTGDLGEVDGDARIALGIQWRALQHHWSHSAQLEWSASDIPADNDGLAARVATRWRDLDKFTDDLDVGLAAQFDSSGEGATADLRHDSELGRGQMAVSHNRRNQFEQTQYLAGYDTSVVIGETWRPTAGGGPRSGEAAVILDLRDGDGSIVDVFSEGQRQFSARGGRRVPLTLSPYSEYQISLIDRGTELVNFDSEPKRLVLYPGDVKTLSWNMQRVNVIVGRLQRLEEFCSEVTGDCYNLRLPLANTRVEGLEGFIFTDDDGFFQGDIRAGVTELTASHGGKICTMDISQFDIIQGVIRAAGLICSPPEQAN